MVSTPKTVRIETLAAQRAIRLCWERWVQRDDITAASQVVTSLLDQAVDHPLRVIVDLHRAADDVMINVGATALITPYRHPRLDELLLCGPDTLTRPFRRLLALHTGGSDVRCFMDHEDLRRYLADSN